VVRNVHNFPNVPKTAVDDWTPAEIALTDRLALAFDAAGVPPMPGRILAFLLCCEPATQSLPDIGSALGASKGGVSQAARLLVQLQLIERVAVRGSRQLWYRLRDDAWLAHMRGDIERIRTMLRILDDGLAGFAGAPAERSRRLREMRALYAFYERKLPDLMTEWLATRARGEFP
jgi:hypothetical protein